MCGRFTLTVDYPGLRGRYMLDDDPELDFPGPRYNIAPSQKAVVIIARPETGKTEAAMMKWGFESGWPHGGKSKGGILINARAETIAEKKSFAESLESRRCIIPADGFYEWRMEGSRRKTPLRFTLKGGGVFSMAGLWKEKGAGAGGAFPSFTILTTSANELVSTIHNRMPVILPRDIEADWIRGSFNGMGDAQKYFNPYPSGEMDSYQVSPIVNSASTDSPKCVKPFVKADLFSED